MKKLDNPLLEKVLPIAVTAIANITVTVVREYKKKEQLKKANIYVLTPGKHF